MKINTIINYILIIVIIYTFTNFIAFSYAINGDFASAMWEPSKVCRGQYSTAKTQIVYVNLYVGYYKYRIELYPDNVLRPIYIGSNIPHASTIKWRSGSGKFFSGKTVHFWESYEWIQYSLAETYWYDFKSGSDYPELLKLKVGDVAWGNYVQIGTAVLNITTCGGGGPLSD